MNDFFYCETCYIELSNKNLIEQHRSTEKHQECEKLRQAWLNDVPKAPWTCELCCRTVDSSNNMKKHLESSQHKQKEALRNRIEQLNNQEKEKSHQTMVVNSIREYKNGDEFGYECSVCEFKTANLRQLVEHLEGVEHKKRFGESKKGKIDIKPADTDTKLNKPVNYLTYLF